MGILSKLTKYLQISSSVLYFLVVVVGGLFAKLCLTLAAPWTVAHQPPLSMGFSRNRIRVSCINRQILYQLSYVIMPILLGPHYLTLHDLIRYPRTQP